MLKKIKLYFNTVKNLRLSQIFWQIFYRLKSRVHIKEETKDVVIKPIMFLNFSSVNTSYKELNYFNFLNLGYRFKEINWGFSEYGKLWNYNLEYFDYLFQQDVSVEEKLRLLHSFYKYSIVNKRTLEPYPVSLRIINIIKYISINDIQDEKIFNYVHQESIFLNKNLEYHILGNHLLENAFALLLSSKFFKNKEWHDKATELLLKELDKQILKDGAHFELSPMYHKIIFFRILELIDWYSRYDDKNEKFLLFCKEVASKMRSWLERIKFKNGDIPLFNDAANGIAYPSSVLLHYADQLNINSAKLPLGDSGYREFKGNKFEIKIDLAQIGASYQPGHAHADALSFIVYYEGNPLFVEQGTSTYQIGERRRIERSTAAHNTVNINDEDQSQVWGGFRVAQRAITTIHEESASTFVASHDGYKKLGILHTRDFVLNDSEIQLIDTLSRNAAAKFHLHLHPGHILSRKDEYSFAINNSIKISFIGASEVSIVEYEYADRFNQYTKGQKLIVSFNEKLISKILFEQ